MLRKDRKEKGKGEIRQGAQKHENTTFKQGDFETAIRSYSEAIKQTPYDVFLYTNRAQVL